MLRRVLSTIVIPSVVSIVIACGSKSGSVFDTVPCKTTFTGQCGQACTVDDQCPKSMHCNTAEGGCTVECLQGEQCNGFTCTDRGRCAASDSPTFIPGQNPGGDSGVCAENKLKLGKVVPTVVIIVDQSGIMTSRMSNQDNTQRWDAVRNALMDPTNGVVKRLENEVIFGLALYTGIKNPKQCPLVTTPTFKLGNHADIKAFYDAAKPQDDTPTGESFRQIVGLDAAGNAVPGGFALMPTQGPKIVILATDGDPDSCANPDSNGTQPPKDLSYAALADGFKRGIPTYVIAVSNEVSNDVKRQLANAGAGIPAPYTAGNTKFYDSNNTNDLVTAFQQIIGTVRTCNFTLNGKVIEGQESKGKVTLNGKPLGYNDPNGWKLNNPSEVQLLGAACDEVKNNANAEIAATFPCNTVSNIQ